MALFPSRRILRLASLAAACAVCAPAFALRITGFSCVAPHCARADAVFSGAFKVSDVQYVKYEQEAGAVVMPASLGKDGMSYTDIRIKDKRLFDSLNLVFETKTVQAARGAVAWRAVSARKLASPVRIANVEIEFDGELAVTFGLLKIARKKSGSAGKTVYYRVAAPDGFEFLDEKLKQNIKAEVIKAGVKVFENGN